MVAQGSCPLRPTVDASSRQPVAWEQWQLEQYGQTQQLSCNPAKYFTIAMTKCPQALRMNFPCDPNKLDYDFCNCKIGGMVVAGPPGPRAYIEAAGEWNAEDEAQSKWLLDNSTYILRFKPKLTPLQIAAFPQSFRKQLIWNNAAIRFKVPSVLERQERCKYRFKQIVECQKQYDTPALKGSCGTIIDCASLQAHPITFLRRFDKLIITQLFDPIECAAALCYHHCASLRG